VAAAIANARVFEEERKRVETLAELDRAKNLLLQQHRPRIPHHADVVTARTNINGIGISLRESAITTRTGAA